MIQQSTELRDTMYISLFCSGLSDRANCVSSYLATAYFSIFVDSKGRLLMVGMVSSSFL